MKRMKQLAAGALACATLATSSVALTGCGSTWALKTDNAEISSGVYRYGLLYAYQQASWQISDYTLSVFDQDIGDVSGDEYVRQEALDGMIKPFLVIEDKMAELGLSLTDLERYNAEASATETWESDDFEYYREMLEEYGITCDDYKYAYYEYSAKYTKVFQALYGEGGELEVTQDEMTEYFTENYSDIAYLIASTYNDDGTEMSDDEIKDLKKQFKAYAAEINDGERTLEEVAKEYNGSDDTEDETAEETTEGTASAEESTEDETADDTDADTDDAEEEEDYGVYYATTEVTTDNSFPEDFVTAVNKMDNNTAKVVDLSDSGYIVLVLKNDIADAVDNYLNNEDEDTKEDNIFNILVAMRQTDYQEYIADLVANFDESRITYNPEYSTDLDLKAIFEPEEETEDEETSDDDTTVEVVVDEDEDTDADDSTDDEITVEIADEDAEEEENDASTDSTTEDDTTSSEG